MKTIEITIQPYSYKREEVQVGDIIDGEFVQKRGIWNVLKDSRLTVKRTYEGKGTATNVTFSIQVPDNYPLAIAAWRLGGNVQSTSRGTHTIILFNPEEEATKANISGFFAALASFVEQEMTKSEEVEQVESVEVSEEPVKAVLVELKRPYRAHHLDPVETVFQTCKTATRPFTIEDIERVLLAASPNDEDVQDIARDAARWVESFENPFSPANRRILQEVGEGVFALR